jgi:hypothetical protein
MADFFGENIVLILQTGFTGVSVLLMYMAYRLLTDSIKSEQDIEKLKVNRTSVFGFMAFSTFVMAGALYLNLPKESDGVIKVNIAFLPSDPAALEMLDFSVANVRIDVPEQGVLQELELKNDRGVTVDLNRMNTHLVDLKKDKQSLEANNTSLEKDKLGLRSQLDLFIKEKAETVLEAENIVVSQQTRDEESGA